MSPNNTDLLPTFTPTGVSNNPPYPHNESTPTSAPLGPLRNASAEQSICTFMPNPFSREHPSNDTEPERTGTNLLSPSQRTFSHRQSSCPQPIYEARSLRQHGAMGRRRCTTQGSGWSFPAPSINRVPVASMGLSQGNNRTNLVALDSPMSAVNAYTFPNFTYNVVQEQDQHVFSGTNRVINNVQQLQAFIPGKKGSNVGAMGFEYGFSDAHMKFNNRQHPRSPNSTSYPMPVRSTRKRISYAYSVVQGQIQIQSSTGKMSDSANAEVKRHSTYSPSVSVDGTRWHCNGCEYTTEREQDVIRHCSTLRHGGRRFFACPSCGKKFSRKDSVTRHSKKTSCGLRRAPLSGISG